MKSEEILRKDSESIKQRKERKGKERRGKEKEKQEMKKEKW